MDSDSTVIAPHLHPRGVFATLVLLHLPDLCFGVVVPIPPRFRIPIRPKLPGCDSELENWPEEWMSKIYSDSPGSPSARQNFLQLCYKINL